MKELRIRVCESFLKGHVVQIPKGITAKTKNYIAYVNGKKTYPRELEGLLMKHTLGFTNEMLAKSWEFQRDLLHQTFHLAVRY